MIWLWAWIAFSLFLNWLATASFYLFCLIYSNKVWMYPLVSWICCCKFAISFCSSSIAWVYSSILLLQDFLQTYNCLFHLLISYSLKPANVFNSVSWLLVSWLTCFFFYSNCSRSYVISRSSKSRSESIAPSCFMSYTRSCYFWLKSCSYSLYFLSIFLPIVLYYDNLFSFIIISYFFSLFCCNCCR